MKHGEKLARQVDRRRGGETWKDKGEAKKEWDTIKDDASKLANKTTRKQAKREVAKARNKAYEELYQKL